MSGGVGFLIKSEPVALSALVGAVLVLLARIGLDLSVDEVLAVSTLVTAGGAYLARRKVTPVDPEVVASKLNNALRGQRGRA